MAVVRSSVTASAKYCCSGSLLRFANGSTTIDKRGATAGCGIDVATGALATGEVGEDLGAGQTHQAMTAVMAMTSAATDAAIARMAPRRRGGASRRTPDADKSAMASGRSA